MHCAEYSNTDCHYAECQYTKFCAKCRYAECLSVKSHIFIVTLSVVVHLLLGVIMIHVVIMSVVMFTVLAPFS
jgi:hypothetical protein